MTYTVEEVPAEDAAAAGASARQRAAAALSRATRNGAPADHRAALPDYRVQQALEHWRRSVPDRFATATWSSVLAADPPIDARVLKEVGGWLDGPTGSLVLTGDVGVAKSYLASACCHELAVRRGWLCDFVPLGEFFEESRAGTRGTGPSALDRYGRAHCLVLDDVASGRQSLTEFEEDRLYLLVNRRWLDRRPTIVTTNLNLGAPLEGYLGVRIADRMKHESLAVVMPGVSRRTDRFQS